VKTAASLLLTFFLTNLDQKITLLASGNTFIDNKWHCDSWLIIKTKRKLKSEEIRKQKHLMIGKSGLILTLDHVNPEKTLMITLKKFQSEKSIPASPPVPQWEPQPIGGSPNLSEAAPTFSAALAPAWPVKKPSYLTVSANAWRPRPLPDGLGHCLPANFDHVNPKNTFDDADAEEIPK
jgi:hypothetical protein